jgi:hypothetical protein
MPVKVTKVEVWAGEMVDQPGGLARVLGAVGAAGADLECVIARRQPDKPGSGVVFVTPIKGRKAQDAAKAAGLMKAGNIATLRVDGADKPGLGGRITQAIADAGVNMRGVSAAVVGNKFVAYIGFDSADDANKAARALRGV